MKKTLVLMVLDGWGFSETASHNAIAAAKTPQWDAWWQHYPHTLLDASGEIVGLPPLQMGNSEVGHMHIGAGRVIHQDLTRINESILTGEFYKNPLLLSTLDELKSTNKTLHVMGLLSSGGVHSHESHLFALLALCHQEGVHNISLHLFLDGRDSPPHSALSSIEKLNHALIQYPGAKVSSISGRYYAMDRDNRWDRTERTYRLLVEGKAGEHFNTSEEAIQAYYLQKISDEFIPPTLIGEPYLINEGDTVLFTNFRADRARQLTQAFVQPQFHGFVRPLNPQNIHFISMTTYAADLPIQVIFPPMPLTHTLGQLIAEEGLTQLRLAETEKYAHVTFFFNGGAEQPFANEDRVLIPSPSVATYDLTPQMSAEELTSVLIEAIMSHAYDVIICNYANADMVGHTGNFAATVRAVEFLDACMRDVGDALNKQGGELIITADHGNAESMFNESIHEAHTAHTSSPVPFLYVGNGYRLAQHKSASLIDIAPTILCLLGISQPKEMSGHSLLVPENAD